MLLKEDNPKNAIFGFASMFFTILEREKPDYIALTFDRSKSFRHDLKEDYKGTRAACPELLRVQMPKIYDMMDVMGIKHFHVDNYEADDMIGTLACKFTKEHEDLKVIIYSGDMDLMQLINDRIIVAVPGKELQYFGAEEVQKKYGISPSQIPDYKGIVGDSSDNIKGVPGVGPKTACELLQKYGTFEEICRNIPELKAGLQKKFEEGCKLAEESKHLATIVTNIPIELDLEDIRFTGLKHETLPFFVELGFPALKKKAEKWIINTLFEDASSVFSSPELPQKPENEQLSLF